MRTQTISISMATWDTSDAIEEHYYDSKGFMSIHQFVKQMQNTYETDDKQLSVKDIFKSSGLLNEYKEKTLDKVDMDYVMMEILK